MNRRQVAIGAAVVLGLAAFALVLPTLDLSSTSFSAYGSDADDTSMAVNGLRASGFDVSALSLGPTALSGVDVDRTDAVYLAIGPERGYTGAEADALFSFVEEGGVAIVLDDTGASSTVLERVGVDRGPVLLSTQGDESMVNLAFGPNRVNLWEPVELVPGEDADVTVIAEAGNRTVKDAGGTGEVSPEDPTCAGGCPVAIRATHGEGSLYVVSDATFATNQYQNASGVHQALESLTQEHLTGQRALVVVDESRHVAGFSEVGLTLFRTLLVPAGMDLVPHVLAGGVGMVAVWAAVNRESVPWPTHDPGLDEPYLREDEDQEGAPP